MQRLSSYVVTCTSTIRVNAYTADDAQTAALEILRRDGPDDIEIERTDGTNDRDYS